MLIVLPIRERDKLFNINSHNYKFQVIKNLRDTNKNKFVFSYFSQDNNIMLIYKYCCSKKRLNVTGCCSFSAKWGKTK